MKRKYLLFLIISSVSLNAIDIKYGKGTFDVNMGINKLININTSIDIDTLTISNNHDNIGNSNFYYFYDVDVYQSDYKDIMLDMFSGINPIFPINPPIIPPLEPPIKPPIEIPEKPPISIPGALTSQIPIERSVTNDIAKGIDKGVKTTKKLYESSPVSKIPITKKATDMIPTPFDIKVKGFDMNIGAGYDIFKNKNGYIGVGVATGLSAPYVYTKNGKTPMIPAFGMMNFTNTSMLTYKTAVSLQSAYRVIDGLKVESSFLYGYHFGKLDNDFIQSEIDIDGVDSMFNIGLSYSFGSFASWAEGITLSAGFTYKSWEMEDAKVKLFDSIFEGDLSKTMNADFDSKNYYLGIGYRF